MTKAAGKFDDLSEAEMMFRLADARPDKYQQALVEVLGLSPDDSPFSFDVIQCPACNWMFSLEHYRSLRSPSDYDCPQCKTCQLTQFNVRPA